MIALLFALHVGAADAADREFRNADEVLAQFKGEPSVQEVHAMVLEYSRTDNRYLDSWMRAAKSASWAPEVQVAYGYDSGYDNDFDYFDGNRELTGAGADVGQSVDVKAKWRFDKLVMSSERIRVISETQDVVKLRDKVLDEVTRLYFDRRRLQVDMLLSGPGDVKSQLKNELRLQELTAQLDAYTGGRFSEALRRK